MSEWRPVFGEPVLVDDNWIGIYIGKDDSGTRYCIADDQTDHASTQWEPLSSLKPVTKARLKKWQQAEDRRKVEEAILILAKDVRWLAGRAREKHEAEEQD